MLDRINAVSSSVCVNKVNQNVNFKGSNVAECVTNPNLCKNGMCGNDALGAYNKGLMNLEKSLNVEKIAPIKINVEDVQGERIYGSNGKLRSIIDNDGEIETIYTIDEKNPEKFSNITKINLQTDNKIYEQVSEKEDDLDVTYVYKYDKNTGKNIYMIRYENDEFDYAQNTQYKPNGSEINIGTWRNGTYHISANNNIKNSYTYIDFDKDKNIKGICEDKQNGNLSMSNRIYFYNGVPISVHHSEDIVIPNYFGREVLDNPEVKPAQKFIIDKDYRSIQGNKTYYSNGNIESNEIETQDGKIIAYFNADGSYNKIITGDKEILFNDDKEQTITEKFDNENKKITVYLEDDNTKVRYETPKTVKVLHLDKKGIPSYYYEEPTDDNDRNFQRKSYFFNDQGMLTDFWN